MPFLFFTWGHRIIGIFRGNVVKLHPGFGFKMEFRRLVVVVIVRSFLLLCNLSLSIYYTGSAGEL